MRLAQRIADRESTMPMLANVLLRTQGKNQLLEFRIAKTELRASLPRLRPAEHLAAQLEHRRAQRRPLERVGEVRAQVAELVARVVPRALHDDAVHALGRADQLAQGIRQLDLAARAR